MILFQVKCSPLVCASKVCTTGPGATKWKCNAWDSSAASNQGPQAGTVPLGSVWRCCWLAQLGGGATGSSWVEARTAANKRPIMHGTASTMKNYPDQNVSKWITLIDFQTLQHPYISESLFVVILKQTAPLRIPIF